MRGKTVIITGVSAGKTVAYGCALAFAKAGADVVVAGYRAGKLKGVCRELEANGAKVTALSVREASEDAFAAAIDEAVERFGRIDVLVNCAQAAKSGVELQDLAAADLTAAVETGPVAAFMWMKACYPHLVKTRGSVVNFASYAALNGQPGQAPLAVAKEGLRALSRVAANEWRDAGVRVNCICPLARTGQLEQWAKQFPQDFAAFEAELPQGGLASVEEVGEACVRIARKGETGMTYRVPGLERVDS